MDFPHILCFLLYLFSILFNWCLQIIVWTLKQAQFCKENTKKESRLIVKSIRNTRHSGIHRVCCPSWGVLKMAWEAERLDQELDDEIEGWQLENFWCVLGVSYQWNVGMRSSHATTLHQMNTQKMFRFQQSSGNVSRSHCSLEELTLTALTAPNMYIRAGFAKVWLAEDIITRNPWKNPNAWAPSNTYRIRISGWSLEFWIRKLSKWFLKTTQVEECKWEDGQKVLGKKNKWEKELKLKIILFKI